MGYNIVVSCRRLVHLSDSVEFQMICVSGLCIKVARQM